MCIEMILFLIFMSPFLLLVLFIPGVIILGMFGIWANIIDGVTGERYKLASKWDQVVDSVAGDDE